MQRLKSIVFNACFAANCLLLVLLLLEDRLQIPLWLQVAGRMHPLVLHFPLVLVLLAGIWETASRFRVVKTDHQVGDFLLLSSALTAVFAALMGFFLSREPGYDATQIALHKWTGVALSLFCLAWYTLRHWTRQHRIGTTGMAMASLALMTITGHEGGTLTHGEDFLTAPMASAAPIEMVPFADAKVFDHVVQPILAEKCISCHNPAKAKGELVLDNIASIIKGGKSGVLWDTTAADYGLMLRRIHLPLEEKKHMPPKAKPQLTEEEMAILFYWIRSGASTTLKLADLPETDSLRILTAAKFNNSGPEVYTFAPADAALVEKLNSHYRLVAPVAANSPALEATFYGATAFTAKALEELQPLAPQLVALHLNNMPVTDADCRKLTTLVNLRELQLSGTKITDTALAFIRQLPQLKHLSVSGTRVTYKGLQALAGAPALQSVYCWNMEGSRGDLDAVQKQAGNIHWESGYRSDTVVLKLSAPIFETDKPVFSDTISIAVKHYIKGAELRYTTDGSQPDSTASALYQTPIKLSQSTRITVRAFRKGWIGSEPVTRQFFRKGLVPDSVAYLTQPDSNYRKRGVARLFDGEKGGNSFGDAAWTGFRKNPMVLDMQFNAPVTLQQLDLSVLEDINSYLFPPGSVELWSIQPNGSKKLLGKMVPEQPKKAVPTNIVLYSLPFSPVSVTRLQLKVQNLAVIPRWHPGKGEKGWFFTDEVFLH